MTGNIWPALLLSSLAGMSTAIGSLITMFSKRSNTKFMSAAFGFSAGVMITVSFAELIPEAQKNISLGNPQYGGAASLCCLTAGLIIAAMIDILLPDKTESNGYAVVENGRESGGASLFHMGIVTALAITIHNFPEGIATFMAGYSNLKAGIPVAVSIAMHNIPEGIAVAAPIYFGTGKRGKAFLYSALSGLSEPVGALAAYLCLAPFINGSSLGGVFGIVAGIMLYIAFGELIPASEHCGKPRVSAAGIVLGALFMLFILTISGF